MADLPELVLLISAESEIESGLALSERIAIRNDYQVCVLVLSSLPTPLVEHAKSRIEQNTRIAGLCRVESAKIDIDALLLRFNHADRLRLLLIPGLDHLNDNRRQLLKNVQAAVVCFEAHMGLLANPSSLSIVGEERDTAAVWFADKLLADSRLRAVTVEELQACAAPVSEAPETSLPETSVPSASDWVLLTCSRKSTDAAAKRVRAAIAAASGPVLLIRGGDSTLDWLGKRYARLVAKYAPQMTRERRQALAEDLTTYSRLDFDFIALICSATFLASFGLVQDSAAVIIGAMLVAPLMTPILGAGLSLAQGNRPLFVSSLKTIAIGFLAALLTSMMFGILIRVLPNAILQRTDEGIVLTREMWSRTSPTIIDFLVGLVGGSAAAYARTRQHLSAALAGAAIAAALVPPIATAGLQLSLIFQSVAPPSDRANAGHLIYGPILLFLANMLMIMIGSAFVLWACGVRSDRAISIKDRWTTRMIMLLLLLTVVVAVWIMEFP